MINTPAFCDVDLSFFCDPEPALIVRMFCAEDSDLVSHYAGGERNAADACADDILANISADSSFYVVVNDDYDFVGYFAQAAPIDGAHVLEAFLIRKQFRNKETIGKFWEIVRESFGDTIYIALDVWNDKAIAHLEKNNFEILCEQDYSGRKCILLMSSF